MQKHEKYIINGTFRIDRKDTWRQHSVTLQPSEVILDGDSQASVVCSVQSIWHVNSMQPSCCESLLTLNLSVSKFRMNSINSQTKLLFIAAEKVTFWRVKVFTPETKWAVSLILTHKMTFTTRTKMINVQKKHLTVAWFYNWIIRRPWSCGAEHRARDGKYHCFGCVRWHTNAPVWIKKRRGVHVCEARLCERGGDRARGRGLTLWEPRSVEWTTVNLGSVLSSGRKRGYWALLS